MSSPRGAKQSSRKAFGDLAGDDPGPFGGGADSPLHGGGKVSDFDGIGYPRDDPPEDRGSRGAEKDRDRKRNEHDARSNSRDRRKEERRHRRSDDDDRDHRDRRGTSRGRGEICTCVCVCVCVYVCTFIHSYMYPSLPPSLPPFLSPLPPIPTHTPPIQRRPRLIRRPLQPGRPR